MPSLFWALNQGLLIQRFILCEARQKYSWSLCLHCIWIFLVRNEPGIQLKLSLLFHCLKLLQVIFNQYGIFLVYKSKVVRAVDFCLASPCVLHFFLLIPGGEQVGQSIDSARRRLSGPMLNTGSYAMQKSPVCNDSPVSKDPMVCC